MQAQRQPGSSFKPFVYAAALDNGYTPASKVLDAPFEMDMGPGQGIWRPENFEHGDYLGDTTLRRGLELSRNLMTVRLAHAHRHGQGGAICRSASASMTSCRRCWPIRWARTKPRLMRMVTGYSEFVNGGKKISASLIDRIQDRNGKTIWRHDARNCEGCNDADWHGQEEPLLADTREQIIDPRTAYQIVSMLQGVVQRGTGLFGRRAVGKPLAGKTGTSHGCARTPGSSASRPTWRRASLSASTIRAPWVRNEQGATVAAPIFRDFMKDALEDAPPTPFRVAPGIEEVADRLEERQSGSAPARRAPSWKPSRPAPRRAKPTRRPSDAGASAPTRSQCAASAAIAAASAAGAAISARERTSADLRTGDWTLP